MWICVSHLHGDLARATTDYIKRHIYDHLIDKNHKEMLENSLFSKEIEEDSRLKKNGDPCRVIIFMSWMFLYHCEL